MPKCLNFLSTSHTSQNFLELQCILNLVNALLYFCDRNKTPERHIFFWEMMEGFFPSMFSSLLSRPPRATAGVLRSSGITYTHLKMSENPKNPRFYGIDTEQQGSMAYLTTLTIFHQKGFSFTFYLPY